MEILHITTFLQGGAGRILCELALEQYHLGHGVTVVASKSPEPGYCSYGEYIETLKRSGIDFYEIDSTFKRDIYQNLNVAERVKKVIEEKGVDVIHAHAAVPGLIGIVARAGYQKHIPVIQTMHGWGTNKRPEHEKMDITVMNSLDRVVAVSKSDKILLEEKGVKREKLQMIFNGINETSILSEDEIINELKSFKQNGFRMIGCIGTVCERKKQELLLDAFKNIADTQRAVCIFLGEGELIPTLQDKVERYGMEDRVRFYGYCENAGGYLKEFDCLVLPSNSEGLPLTVLEAFRDKIPVIVSDIPVFKEIVEDNITGYLFSVNSVPALSLKLEQVLKAENKVKNLMVEAAYQKFVNHFTKSVMLNEYMKLYAEII